MLIQLPVLAVLGSGKASPAELEAAESVGRCAAEAGWVVLTGGGPGVMEAACHGAVRAGGLTVGVVPFSEATSGYPNPWVRIPIFTGMGSARNAINVLSASLCIGLGGGAGTLSEVALACKAGCTVWWWRPWRLTPPEGGPTLPCRTFDDLDGLMEALTRRLEEDRPTSPE